VNRPTLRELRGLVLDELISGRWISASEVTERLGVGHGRPYERVALVLERLAHEGVLELENPRSRGKRYFRRRQARRPDVRVHAPPRFDDENPLFNDAGTDPAGRSTR
jgi:hypothetical protein